MVVAVDADLLHRFRGEGLELAELFLERGRRLQGSPREVADVGRKRVERGGERVLGAVEPELHALLPGPQVLGADRLGLERRRRGGGQRRVERAGQSPQPSRFPGVGRGEGPREGGIGRPAGLRSGHRHREVLAEPGLQGRPGVTLVGDELVKGPDRRRLLAGDLVLDGAPQPGGGSEGGVAGEEVGDLELGVGAGLELPEDLQDGPAAEHDRGVALLGLDAGDLARRLREHVGEGGRGAEVEAPVAPREHTAGADLLDQRRAEGRVVESVGDDPARRTRARLREQRNAVGLGRRRGEVDAEEGEHARGRRHRRVVERRHAGDGARLGAEPAP